MKLGGFSERGWRRRGLGALLALALLLMLGTPVAPGPPVPLPGPGEAPLVYTPIPFDGGDPRDLDAGRLHFLGGWTMTSPDLRLGGLSGLRVEGDRAIAVSDIGMVDSFPLPGTTPAPRIRFQPVIEGPGPERRRSNRDTEGIWVEGDRLWLSFERQNAVWRYNRASLRAEAGARPARMRRWWGNSGAETIARLGDGRFLVIEEGRDDGSPTSDAVLFGGDPALPETPTMSLRYRRPPGYRATDAAPLPDGRVLILNRALSGLRLSAKLVLADLRGLPPGGTIAGAEIATLEAPLVIDNMEGIAVTQERGRTIVWLVSDDDFMRLFRRTLLLKFELRL